jgi:hypothetical protein
MSDFGNALGRNRHLRRRIVIKLRVVFLATAVLALAGAGQLAAATAAGAATSSPPAPTPLAPANGASVTVPFTLSWSAVTDSAGVFAYNWQVSPAQSMNPIIAHNSPSAPQTSDTVSGLANGTYFWQVQAVDNNIIVSPWSAPQSFTVTGANSGELSPPVLNPPQTGATSFHPMFLFGMSWSSVAGATAYQFEFNTVSAAFDVIHSSKSVLACVSGLAVLGFPPPPPPPANTCATLTGNFLQPGTYFYRVQAINASGALSVPSNVDTITISYSAPLTAPPQPVGPATGTTLSFPFSVSFANVAIPQLQGYEVQFSTTSSFKTIEFDVPLIDPDIPFATRPGSTSTLTVTQGLAGGTTFWRVRAFEGDNSASTAAVTAFSGAGSFVMSSAPPAVVSLTASTPTVSNGGSGGSQIQLSTDAPSGGSVVNLTSSNPAALTVPPSVTIQQAGQFGPFIGAGAATGQFQYQAGLVTSPTPVTVTATLGSSSATAIINVVPPALQQLTLDPTVVPGGEPPTAIIALNGNAPPGGATVALSSSSPAVHVPATATVPDGSPTTFVSVTTSEVSANTTATVTATYNGASASTQLTLTPQQPPASVSLSPTATTGTDGSAGVVHLQSPAANDGAVISLSSSNPAVASVPPLITIGSFGVNGGFNVATTQVSTQTTVTISATAAGVTVTTTLTLTPTAPPPPPNLTLTLNPATVEGGSTSTGTASLSAPAPTGGTTVSLTSGLDKASVPSSVVIAAGQTSASFTITTTPVSSTTVFNLSATANGVTAFAPLTLTSASSGSLTSLSLNPTSVRGGSRATATVTLDVPAPSGGASVTVGSSNTSAASVPASVTVPAGATSTSFTVTTPSVNSDTSSQITGTYNGATQSATLTVTRR